MAVLNWAQAWFASHMLQCARADVNTSRQDERVGTWRIRAADGLAPREPCPTSKEAQCKSSGLPR